MKLASANLRREGAALLYLVSYIALDWLSYVQPVLKLGITPWNPQAGLTLAYLLVLGPTWLWVTALAALLSEVLVRDNPATSALVLALSAWIALGYAALAALLRRWKLSAPLATQASAARLAGASVVASLVIAVGYVALVTATRALPDANFLDSIARFWVGDLNGILTLTPLLLYARSWRSGVEAIRARRWEVAAQLGAVLATLWVIFDLAAANELRVFYPLFVPVIWIALRWGLPGAVLATLAIQIALVMVARDETRVPPLIDLQFLMVTLSLTALMLGAVITERVSVLRRVARSEAEQRALLAMAPDAVLVTNADERIQIANPAAIGLFGATAAAQPGPRLRELLPAIALEAEAGRAALEGRRSDGSIFPAEVAWAQLDAPASEGFLVTVRDATDRHRAAAQLRERETALARAMRFAVAGELASALAHELNQPITALVSYLRASEILAMPFRGQDERIPSTLAKAAHEAIRASEVLRRLRDFYRGSGIKYETIHVPTICSTVSAAFQERLRRANVSLVMHMEDQMPSIQGDSIHMEMVLHNLIANAIDAVGQCDAASRRVELSAVKAGDAILIRVTDSGPGISEEIGQRLFEPFTTSKADGMGLGLAISRSLVRARGGDLTLDTSAPCGRTAFLVRMPIQIPKDLLP